MPYYLDLPTFLYITFLTYQLHTFQHCYFKMRISLNRNPRDFILSHVGRFISGCILPILAKAGFGNY